MAGWSFCQRRIGRDCVQSFSMLSLQPLHVSAQQRSGCQEVVASRGRDWSTFVCSDCLLTDTEASIRSSTCPQLKNSGGFPSPSRRGASKTRWREKNTSCTTDRVCSDCQIAVLHSYSSLAIHSTAYSSKIPANAVYIPKTNKASSKSGLTASHLVFFQLVQIHWASCSTCMLVFYMKTSNLLKGISNGISETHAQGRWTMGCSTEPYQYRCIRTSDEGLRGHQNI